MRSATGSRCTIQQTNRESQKQNDATAHSNLATSKQGKQTCAMLECAIRERQAAQHAKEETSTLRRLRVAEMTAFDSHLSRGEQSSWVGQLGFDDGQTAAFNKQRKTDEPRIARFALSCVSVETDAPWLLP